MKAKKPLVGDVVHIVFWDHCENFHDAMKFDVYGKLTKITPKAYIIHTWVYNDPIQRATDSDPKSNENSFAIVKMAIESIRVLK